MAPAVIQHPDEDLPTQLRGMSMSSLSQRLLTFALNTLEQPIHGGAMQRDRTEPLCLCGGHSLLHVPDNLPPDELTSLVLVRCHYKWHGHRLHPLSFTLLLAFTGPTATKSDGILTVQHLPLETLPRLWNNSM